MSTSIAKRLIQLSYEWNAETNTHELTWDTDYPVNVTGVFTKLFKAGHTYTRTDKITLNGEEYKFQSLSGDPARSKIFLEGQYVPIAIDLDEKIIAYYSMSGGSGSGSGGVTEITIPKAGWSDTWEYVIPIPEIHEESTVILMMGDNITKEESLAIQSANITATQDLSGITLKCENVPVMDFHIIYVLI